jgi:23S rRNA (cytidine1920-2'-O)/16S rRNA (cytidine1409-2'-O)-methyltransferase
VAKQRLDKLLVDRGLAPSRERAAALVMAGRVRGPDRLYTKPGHAFAADVELCVTPLPRFVSRGGDKLEAAINRWPIHVQDRIAMDIGASTGGFTDCLLQRGATQVYAVDVGVGQLADKLRRDSRVVNLEGRNARDLPRLSPSPSLAVMDVAFISARTLLPSVAAAVEPGSDLLLLIKPQFEAPRDAVDARGVVLDPTDRAATVTAVTSWALARRWRLGGVHRSPLRGPAGNREYFVWLRTPTVRNEDRPAEMPR